MTGSGTSISDPQGPVHSGGGDQNNTYYYSVGPREPLVRTGVDRLEIVREHRRRLAKCFVWPGGYARAADRLAQPGAAVLLEGPGGIGRRSAATMLLMGASVPGSRIEELPTVREEEPPDPSPDDRYLLDLSSIGDGDYPAAQRTLMSYCALVEKSGARLVAVSPSGLEWMLDAELAPLTVRLERPSGRAVFSRHLRVRGVGFAYEQLDHGDLPHLFETAPMGELDRLAGLVVQARDRARRGTEFEHWRDEAVAAATNWSQQVAGDLRQHRDAEERALLLAASMTSGGPADTVLSAAHSLLAVLGHPQDETPRLARAGLGEQFEELSLVREDDGRVRFVRLAYDDAVRRHFWENFPDLRADFRDWVGECMELPGLGAEDRARLVSRFAEQALRTDRPDDLHLLIEKWSRPSAGGRLLRAEAAAALELGLSHERYGSRFRSHVYQWVTTARIEPDLARVLTVVCRRVMAVTHPEQAMVRLRHLALRQENPEDIKEAARSALLELARGNRRLYGRLVHRLLPRARPVDGGLDILLALLDPAELRVPPPWQAFVLAWRAVMAGKPPRAWSPAVQRWLAALALRQARDEVLNALLLAAYGDRDLLNQLYVMTCDWADSEPVDMPEGFRAQRDDRVRTADRFCREIDLAQGVGGVSSATGARKTEEGP
ncbi:hypothetical protein STAN_3679 [Streptomyces sp. CBMAI 2042]|uniref:hypothetical protein n=1 Tax=Streptomyces sp. CBMAI 2042 TaxID=2305222 RepID=UPI000F133D99|nr:hypothetical protein [Streptomyces sp. CBMAI 2042]RLV68155.1 hypothetical protein STAN_3679 [Streptomyces sp. CBMAI 2042]